MNIIIAGTGKVGGALTRLLSSEGYDLTVIDLHADVLESIVEKHDVISVEGNCAQMSVLKAAGVETADLLIAATREDEVNLLCCMTAHALNPKIHTIARIRDPEYNDQIYMMRDSFALSMAVNPELQAATEIARLLEYPGFLQRDSFVQDRVEIVEILLNEKNPLCDKALIDLPSIAKCRVLVCTVVRDRQTIMPDGHFVLRAGDRIFVTAPTQELTTLLSNLGILTRKVRRVALCGGGRVSFYLAKMLLRAGISVLLIEKDPERARELSELLPDADVVLGDATSHTVLEQEDVDRCDAVVSLTGLDEMNIIISLYAHDLGVSQVITKVGREESIGIVNRLATGSAICPQELCGSIIVRYVRAAERESGAAITIHSIASGMAEASEFMVDEKTLNRGKPLRDIRLRKNTLLVCISRNGRMEIPNGNSSFETGDTVVVVTERNSMVQELNDIFQV
ncbi:MAG: Trk system potassium transporter TrkA [Lachnospiraceae bacterium]|nr:Trk system potassium transporter TrkA [Lachnospiraceae bacterium]